MPERRGRSRFSFLITDYMNIVILAAGQGKRMHSNLPKVLHPIAGKSLLGHVVDTARSLKPNSLSVVYGHGGDVVRAAFPDADLKWALQSPQLGTGHALLQAMPYVVPGGATLMLYGDVPLIKAETLQRLLHAAQDALAVLTIDLDDPSGYGRVVRQADGAVTRIVEHKDATPEERAIREINTGIMAFPTDRLADWLARLSNDNAQGEYYAPDIVALAVADGVPVLTAQPEAEWEVLGVNSKAQLAELERFVNGQVEAMIDEILSGATAPNPIDRGPSDSECKYCDFSSACHKDVCGVNARRFASVTPEEFWQALERRLEHG